jgi:DNA polymerase-3 subunit alpha
VFQLESGGMRRLAKDLKPNKLTDITAMVALYRPGPMDLIPTFIEGKRNPSSVTYPHKDLKVVLEETYGILVYQEQVIDIAVVMAHFTKSHADLLRMAVGKKKKSLMEKGKIQFIEGCVEHGYKRRLAEDVFGFIEKFAAYGFNKAHAASYALIAYWTAYLKANYPVEFMTSLLTAEINGSSGPFKDEKIGAALEECKRMNILVLPPDINKSQDGFSIENGDIRFGLTAIKNVGSAAIETVIHARADKPFQSFSDFLHRVDLRKVNKKTLESLIKVGAFAAFGNRTSLITVFPELVEQAAKIKESSQMGQSNLFGGESSAEMVDKFPALPEYAEYEIAEFERELIGFLISSSPLTRYQKIIDEKVTIKIKDLTPEDVKKKFILAGVLSTLKIVRTKKDQSEMAIMTLNDGTGTLEMVAFPKTYASIKSVFSQHAPVLVKGTLSQREDGYNLMIDNAINLQKTNSS